jgi:hypothetical protein
VTLIQQLHATQWGLGAKECVMQINSLLLHVSNRHGVLDTPDIVLILIRITHGQTLKGHPAPQSGGWVGGPASLFQKVDGIGPRNRNLQMCVQT